ncbi:MAG: hypothetical protein M3Z05_18870 [Gemmatimonadota bacterium]|nr:hypothetical protein [Gemmatimonadota bacterium]
MNTKHLARLLAFLWLLGGIACVVAGVFLERLQLVFFAVAIIFFAISITAIRWAK